MLCLFFCLKLCKYFNNLLRFIAYYVNNLRCGRCDMKKVYVVTGANGFLGNNIVRKLLKRQCDVRALVLPNDSIRSLDDLACSVYFGDVTKMETLQEIFRKNVDEELVVIHCAAIVYIKKKFNPAVIRVNVDGTKNIVEMCLKTNARMVYVNSVHAIPEPCDDSEIVEVGEFDPNSVVGIYAKSKALAAQLVLDNVRKHGLNATIVHPSGIIGPGDFGMTHMTKLILMLSTGKLHTVVKGGYDFVDVRDVADGIISAIENGRKGECYILSNRYISVKEIADSVCKKCSLRKVSAIPLNVAKAFAPLCELHYTLRKKTPLFTKYSLYTLQAKSLFNHQKASDELMYNPRPLEETISDTVDWLAKSNAKMRLRMKKEYC